MEVLQRTANRGSISTASAYDIDNSSVWESDLQDQAYISQGGTAGTRTKHTWSIWIKRTELGTRQQIFEGGTNNTVTTQLGLSFQTTDALEVRAGEYVNGSNAGTVYRLTTRLFRDTSAWYHIVAAFDTTQGTANDRIKIWVNGVQETSFATTANPGQNTDLGLFAANAQNSIGVSANNGFFINGYLAHPALVYNAQLNADSFGEFDNDSGIWKPIDLSDVTFGTYGYWLKNETSNQMYNDSSGSSRNFARWDDTIYQATDTPTNNFCVMNVNKGITYYTVNGPGTLNRHPIITNGATVIGNNSNNYVITDATMAMTSGKWYWEMKCTVDANTNVTEAGIATNHDLGFYSDDGVGNFFYAFGGGRYVNGGATGYGTAWATNDIIGFAYDADNWTLTCFKNNSSQGNLLASQADLSAKAAIFKLITYGTHTYQMNFGGYHVNSLSSAASDANGYGSFEYAPPSGYYALCSKNLAQYG